MVLETTNHKTERSSSRFFRLPSLPTTAAGAELGVVFVAIAIRLTDVAQLAAAAPNGLKNSTHPGLDGALMALYFAQSLVLLTVIIRRRRFTSLWLAWTDVMLAFVVLACEPLFTHNADRTGSWIAWGYAVSVGAALDAGLALKSRRQVLAAAALLAATYIAVGYPVANTATRATILANALGYAGFAFAGRGVAGYVRRLGTDADTARHDAAQAAARLAEETEFNRHRDLLHNNASILRLIGNPDTPDDVTHYLRLQAAQNASQITAFMGHRAGTTLPDHTTRNDNPADATKAGGPTASDLTTVITTTAAGFGDLPLDLSLDLAAGVTLPEVVAAPLASALSALLHNVRVHARATHVLIHASTTRDGESWELLIADDGTGFNPNTTVYGYGLHTQVRAALHEHDITTRLESKPGDGTRITLTGPIGSTQASSLATTEERA